MMYKKPLKAIFFLLILLISGSFFNTESAEATTGAIYGRVWMYDEWGNMVLMPGVKIYREDNFDPQTTGQRLTIEDRYNDPNLHHLSQDAINEIFRSYKGGVETTSTVDGYWYFGPNHPPYQEGNGLYYETPTVITWYGFGSEFPATDFSLIPQNNDPAPVETSSTPEGYCIGANQSLCPTGSFMNVSTKDGDCDQLNYCGLNCLETPHAYKPYFPPGYTFVDEYFGGTVPFDPNDPKGGGSFRALEARREFAFDPGYTSIYLEEMFSMGWVPWGDYQPKEYYIVNSYNNRYTGPYDFIWTPGESVNSTPPNIVSTTPDNDSDQEWVGTATDIDNGYECIDNNPYTYRAHIQDPDGSKNVDVIEFNLHEDKGDYPPLEEYWTPKRWPLRILFGQKWMGQSGRMYADNTFFVRDREIKEWTSNQCFTKNGIRVPDTPTGLSYPLDSIIEPRKTTEYTLSCYGYDDHTWVDGTKTTGVLNGHPVDVVYLPKDIEDIANSGYELKLKGNTNWKEASYVAYSTNSDDVYVQFKVEFLGDNVSSEWKSDSTFRNYWRVADLDRNQDKTHNEASSYIHIQQIQANYSQYFHNHGKTYFDMIPPSVSMDEPVPSADGETFSIKWDALDNESGLHSVAGEMLATGSKISPVVNQTAIANADKDTGSNYEPWEEGTTPNSGSPTCTDDAECLGGYLCLDGECNISGCERNTDCKAGYQCFCPEGYTDDCFGSVGACEIGCESDQDCPSATFCVDVLPGTDYRVCKAPTSTGGESNSCIENSDCQLGYACVNSSCTTSCESDRDCAGLINGDYYSCDCPEGYTDGDCQGNPGECAVLASSGEEQSLSASVLGASDSGDFTYLGATNAQFKPRFLWNELGAIDSGINNTNATRTEVLDVGDNITKNDQTVDISIYAGATDKACNLSQNPSSHQFLSYDPWYSSRGGLLFSSRMSAELAVTNFENSTDPFSSGHPFNKYPYNFNKGEVSLSSEWLSMGVNGSIVEKHKINQDYSKFYPTPKYEDENNRSHYEPFLENAKKRADKTPSRVKFEPYPSSEMTHDLRNNTCSQSVEDITNGQICVIEATAPTLTITDPGSRFFSCSHEKVIIFVENDLVIDETISAPADGSNGCVFIVGGDVKINATNYHRQGNNYPRYDQQDVLIIADGQISLESSSENYGITVRGGLIATGGSESNPSILLKRSIPMIYSKNFPTYLMQWDPRYAYITSFIFTKEDYEYETEVGYKE